MLKPGKKMETESDSKAGRVDVVAQELKFAKMLASNDSKVRSKILKSLKKWLNTRSQSSYHFTNNDFLRLWKGLYYCMWMSDKPLVQEELTEDLGSLIHCFPDVKVGVQFFQNFLETMCLEWFGIDQWRIDKFMMLVRRVFRQMLFALKNAKWEDESIKVFADALTRTVFQTHKCPKGLIMHICDFYIEELSKVTEGELSEERIFLFIEPFMIYYTKVDDQVLLPHVEKNIFNQLLYQSELGQEYQEKFDIWKQANFPTRSIDDIEVNYRVRENKSFNDDDLSDGQEEDEEERALDPRAGRVDVVLSEMKFDALKIAETMENLRYKPFASSKSRKGLARMAGKFRKFVDNVFPLGTGKLPKVVDEDDSDIDLDLKAMELAEFEKKLAIGDVDSESSSDFDEDLDNRKHGKLKRKSKDEVTKAKEKKQKLSKLHNERFFQDANEDFSKENSSQQEEDESTNELTNTEKVKKKKKKTSQEDEQPPKKLKAKKRKSQVNSSLEFAEESDDNKCTNDLPSTSTSSTKSKKAVKSKRNSTSSTSSQNELIDEWSEPLQEGEVEYFLPSKKHKLKALQDVENSDDSEESKRNNYVLNPFASHTGGVSSSKKQKTSSKSSNDTTTPRIQLQSRPSTGSTGKRVIIALNKNKAQSPHEYIKQVMESPNLPFDSNKKPSKSLLKPNVLPSPINPFYSKKIGLKLNFNDTN